MNPDNISEGHELRDLLVQLRDRVTDDQMGVLANLRDYMNSPEARPGRALCLVGKAIKLLASGQWLLWKMEAALRKLEQQVHGCIRHSGKLKKQTDDFERATERA